MKSKSANRISRRTFWPIIGLAVIILVGGTSFLLYRQHENKDSRVHSQNTSSVRAVNTPSYSPSSAQDSNANDARKASQNPASTLDNSSSATSNDTLSVHIVSANANNGDIHIGTLVSGATTGTCIITATQGQTTVTLSTLPVKQDVNSYDCGGSAINISTSELHPDSGTWQLKLTATSGSSQATDVTSLSL